MELLSKKISKAVERPVRVLQFGEGNFLRGFVDYMIDKANEAGVFDGSVVLLKPIEYGNLKPFHEQECQYTLSLRGRENGETKTETRIITCIHDAVDVIEEYKKYKEYILLDTVRFVISNTTEAGIVYDEGDKFELSPPKTFPGKLTKLLFQRYEHFRGDLKKGLIIIPCELIEQNGKELKKCVYQYCELWNLGKDFETWLEGACYFCTTLVDRIITGYPKEEAQDMFQEFGYEDQLLDTGELFALWVIECAEDIGSEFPLDKARLPVLFTDHLKPYRDRKVRILNGAHTSFVLASYLAGNDYVLQSMEDETVRKFMEHTIYEEVIKTLSLPEQELKDFAAAVTERFENPFIKHELLSIALNSVSKWKARCLPSFTGYVEKYQSLPQHLCFSIAALMSFYSGKKAEDDAYYGDRNGERYRIMDDNEVIEFFAAHCDKAPEEFASSFLVRKDFFGEDMTNVPGLLDAVTGYLTEIREKGMRQALNELIGR